MLHEVYAPGDAASVAWSRQKKVAFLRLISDMQDGMRPPSVVVLYGPTGSGKLSSVRVMLEEQRDALGRPLLVEVMHSCEATPQQYYSFLMDTFTEHEMTGDDAWESHPAASSVLADVSGDVKDEARLPNGAKSHRLARVVARVVKFYGESLLSPLHTRTLRFLDHYDTWRCSELSAKCISDGTGALDGSLLRRHFVFFILTTHDTHSDKVTLGKLLPSRVLTHSCIHFFHCTPLTTRNLTARVKDILRMERQRQKCGVRHRLSDDEVEFLCKHGHGDIRQALLQVQWSCLLWERGLNEAGLTLTSAETQGKEKPQAKSKKLRSVMDLLEDHDSAEVVTSTLQPLMAAEQGSEEETGTAVLFRDEYLDVAHATARILTQKYTLSSVVRELNTEPEKLLGYLTNNMPVYFRSGQMQEYAECAASASAADALRAAESFGKRRQSGASLHTARLTSGDDSDGSGVVGLDLISLILFGKTYEVCHKDVCIPRALVAQRPPPYQPLAYPRLRDVELTRKRSRNDGWGYTENDFEQQMRRGERGLYSTELEWRQEFMRRLQLCEVSGNSWRSTEADIVRESLPALLNRCVALDTVLLEYAPYARCIVLDRSPLSATFRASDSGAIALSKNMASASKRPVKPSPKPPGPKKTLFSFAKTNAPLLQRRPCSLLRYNVLCCGLSERPSVRVDSFFLVPRNDDTGDDDDLLDDTAADSNTPRPLLPDGEDIEEYSD
ncbi:hypothetical protein TraAM80_00443 [Trypanosoma rangeli]|uniref:Uncharacterized protein n=1 Tax=Trypanosoma rangeli TaxID=5698 RepID=A0A3R7LDK5_TRYRA|nr:uncharacterized protein TraAM80_00443 [Trypanosoma rangeli]RNF12295.1 hypothetical protein TraAM80_00443 [Trypanosoma rangeli]|eukprot:RNF12295.1 hypothetical protein TraAM80_00443 [Trypanosoma rangeli]